MFAWSFIDGSPLERAEREAQKADEHLGDNDNDNDILREVPHPSNEGLALQARVSGPWPHKKNLFCWCSLLGGKVCRYKLLEDRLYCNGT